MGGDTRGWMGARADSEDRSLVEWRLQSQEHHEAAEFQNGRKPTVQVGCWGRNWGSPKRFMGAWQDSRFH